MLNIKNECNNCGEPCLDNKCNMKVVEIEKARNPISFS